MDVVAGRILACRYTILACERHLADIEAGKYVWDVDRAEKAIRFFSHLKHYKGPHAGERFKPEPWQCFIIGGIYGWRMPDMSRRFRYAYIEVPRKNGKTTMGAGFGIRELLIEEGAEVYSVGTKEDQAKIGWKDGVAMIRKSPMLLDKLDIRVKEIRHTERNGSWKPLGSDSETLDGLNPSFGFIDELHAWKSRDLWDVIDDGMGARKNPLILEITTAGHNQNGICYEHRKHVISILEGKDGYKDDRFFGVIYTVDDPDNWEDENEWKKANPNYGISKGAEWMRGQHKQATMMTTKLNAFLNKQLNIWTQQEHCWLNLTQWDKCLAAQAYPLSEYKCVGGLDLSSVLDITALTLYWPELRFLKTWFWCPEDGAQDRQKRDRVPYLDWARNGHLEMTPGSVVDYAYIEERILQLKQELRIDQIAYDRWNSSDLVTRLKAKNIRMTPFGQGFASMSGPSKEYERMIAKGELQHDGNPVKRWMVGNVAVDTDPKGNIAPKKPANKQSEKIDGVVSDIMAIGVGKDMIKGNSAGFQSL